MPTSQQQFEIEKRKAELSTVRFIFKKLAKRKHRDLRSYFMRQFKNFLDRHERRAMIAGLLYSGSSIDTTWKQVCGLCFKNTNYKESRSCCHCQSMCFDHFIRHDLDIYRKEKSGYYHAMQCPICLRTYDEFMWSPVYFEGISFCKPEGKK